MNYATYIPSACCLLPQHTLPLDGARRYANPTICTQCYGAQADASVHWFRVHHSWTEMLPYNSSLNYVLWFSMDWYGQISSDSVWDLKWVVP